MQFWKFDDQQARQDESGSPILDAAGKPVMEDVRLQKPRVFTATVFNAAQVDGLPALQIQRSNWDPLAHAETIIRATGADIQHVSGAMPHYSPARAQIVLPERGQFDTPGK